MSAHEAWRDREQRVGVLAVDPTSPFTGGALLGDRVRMQTHATDTGVFIRSMASRGQLGGMAAPTPQAVRVLEATGFDVVLVETVGMGRPEVDIAATPTAVPRADDPRLAGLASAQGQIDPRAPLQSGSYERVPSHQSLLNVQQQYFDGD